MKMYFLLKKLISIAMFVLEGEQQQEPEKESVRKRPKNVRYFVSEVGQEQIHLSTNHKKTQII